MKFTTTLALGLSAAASSVSAHTVSESVADLQAKAALSKRCASSTASFHAKRYARRMAKRSTMAEQLAKRYPGAGNETVNITAGNETFAITAEAPYYDVLQNDTCVLSPEITQGPYIWPRSQTLRQDMTEDQVGVPLWLDVGILNMETCEPMPNALVSFWHCNATGYYSSFTGLSPNTKFEQLLTELNVTDFAIGQTDLHTDDNTWLRGMWPTDENGVMEMKTVFPGFYVERAIHIHAAVHTEWSLAPNGTISTSNLRSVGQLYFDDETENTIMALEPYVSHTQINRTLNSEDSMNMYTLGFSNGYNPVVSVVPVDGKDIKNGMIGYITMGVDPTNVYDETSSLGDAANSSS